MSTRPLLPLPLLLALACGQRPAAIPPGGASCPQTISVPSGCFDLGSARLGDETTRTLEIGNPGEAPIDLCVRSSREAFSVAPERVVIPARGDASVEVHFRPGGRGDQEAELTLSPCGSCSAPPTTICVNGKVRVPGLAFRPGALDLGVHVPGTTTCRALQLVNTGDVPLQIRKTQVPDEAFSLAFPLDGPAIEPGASVEGSACFTPAVLGSLHEARAVASADEAAATVRLTGRCGAARIVAVPDGLDLVTGVGRAVTRRVWLRNEGELTSTTVRAATVAPRDGPLWVQHPALPHDVGRESLPLDITFAGARGAHSGAITVSLQDEAGHAASLAVPVSALAIPGAPCELSLLPERIDFGLVHAAAVEPEVHREGLRLRNAGAEACTVWGFGLDPEGSRAFALEGAPEGITSIAPGAELVVAVVFTPTQPSIAPETSRVVFQRLAAASADPEVAVPVSGFASALCLRVQPDPIDLGRVPLGHTAAGSIGLTNCGTSLIKIGGNDPRQPPEGWRGDIAFEPTNEELSVRAAPSRLPFTLLTGATLWLHVLYTPASTGADAASLAVWLKNAAAPVLAGVLAEGVDEPCGELCDLPQALCPGRQTTAVLGPVTLPGLALDDVDGENPPDNVDLVCSWTVEAAPSGSTALPAEPGQCTTTFVPDRPGDHVLRLTVTDSDGLGASCETVVHARR